MKIWRGFYIGACLAIAMTGVSLLRAQSNAPYPPSPVIQSAKWDFSHLIRLAYTPGEGGSDRWPVTWASDGNVYTSFGDGGGFSGASDGRGRVSLGFAKILGFPPHIKEIDLWGAAPNYAKYPATFCGKPGSMLSVGGVLYAWLVSHYNPAKSDFVQCEPNPKIQEDHLAWSTDLGKTWTQSKWKVEEVPGKMNLAGQFLNFGRNNAGARDQYVYQYTSIVNKPNATYLIRVLPSNLQTDPAKQGIDEYYAGPGPIWSSDVSKARPVFVDPNGRRIFHVVYDAGLRRYIAAAQGRGVGQLGLFDAPEPWGPWTTIAYYQDWGGFGARESLGVDFATKWISPGGKTLWAVFSAGRLKPTDGLLDSFNLVKLHLTLKGNAVKSGSGEAHRE